MEELHRFLTFLSPRAQVAWLEQQPDDIVRTLHEQWGYGAAECDCPIVFLPCPVHELTRFQFVARLTHRGFLWPDKKCIEPVPATLEQIAKLPDRKLFWQLFPEFWGEEGCDCPSQCEPCPHADAPFHSPLSETAQEYLIARALDLADFLDAPEPLDPSPSAKRESKAKDLEDRAAAGFGLWHPGDQVTRKKEPPEFMKRIAHRKRNGHLAPAEVTYREAA